MDHDPFPSHQPRKRKGRDDDPEQQESCTPRLSHGLCQKSMLSPPGSPISKRPRLHDRPFHSRRRSSHRGMLVSSRRCGPRRLGSDMEDMGIRLDAVTSPSTGSIRSLHQAYNLQPYTDYPNIVFGPHVPSLYPPINRHSLKDLNLSHVLRNPQLRHDLLFDPGLHFRPASHRKKDEQADKYWDAVIKEVHTACTCLSFDSDGHPVPCVCACELTPSSSSTPWIVTFAEEEVITVRSPPRLRNLLEDFLSLLLLVIQPLTPLAGLYLNPMTVETQIEQHAAHAEHIRGAFDPALIEQELLYGVFDPSGLFELIADTLKRHCAPMRDAAISAFVKRSNATAGTDAIVALRMCMDVLELMQLDIANHQLHCLRPYLVKSAASFELEIFECERGPDGAIDTTEIWLNNAARRLRSSPESPLREPYFVSGRSWSSLGRNTQIYVAVIRGLVDLVFCPPAPLPHASKGSPATPLGRHSTILPLHGFPETTFLDNSRLIQLAGDALDLTSMHMYLLLFRQLSMSKRSGTKAQEPSQRSLECLREEISDLACSRPGHSILPCQLGHPHSELPEIQEYEGQCELQTDIILQVTHRASELRTADAIHTLHPPPAIDSNLLAISQTWADTHLHLTSDLFIMLRNRLRELVFQAVLVSTYPSGCANMSDLAANPHLLFSHLLAEPSASGLEPLRSDIRLISEKISALAHFHLNTYLPLYEQQCFLDSH